MERAQQKLKNFRQCLIVRGGDNIECSKKRNLHMFFREWFHKYHSITIHSYFSVSRSIEKQSSDLMEGSLLNGKINILVYNRRGHMLCILSVLEIGGEKRKGTFSYLDKVTISPLTHYLLSFYLFLLFSF